MIVQFTLSMPSNNAWDGKWSGEGRLYALVRTYRAKRVYEPIITKRRWTYAFGDGWVAAVSAKAITPAEARKVRKQSRGFCGYDWMVNDIERHGEIKRD